MDSGDFWAKRKEHPGWNAVRTAAMLATGLDALDAEDEREAVRARRWRHNIQKIMLQTSPAVALIPEEAREVTGWLSEIEAYDKMTLYCLNYSKLDKVLHRVAMLEGSPKVRQDPYDICVRARALSERWQPGSLPRTLHEHRSPRLPPALRALPPTVMALDVQPHANPLDLLAAVSIAERLAARSRRPARRVLVSSSAQTDDAFSDGVDGM